MEILDNNNFVDANTDTAPTSVDLYLLMRCQNYFDLKKVIKKLIGRRYLLTLFF
jgi:hypothetical protein